jgi:hypothetical protein
MANAPKSDQFPGNKALQHYFDDLMSPETIQTDAASKSSKPQINRPYEPIDESIKLKISQAERLLAKANALTSLFTDTAHSFAEELPLSQAKEPKEALPTSSIINISPLDELELGLTKTQNSSTAPGLSEKDTILNKENAANADIRDTEGNYSDGTRDVSISLKDSLPSNFQVLLCSVANITIAIPLVELGGIHKLTKIAPMAKQPSWCKGIFLKGSEKFICIDAAEWLIPSKYASSSDGEAYKFAVQLGKSQYMLCCNSINTTVEVSCHDVKWRENPATRPWLAGLLKERMCALIDGATLVKEVLE